MKLNSSSSKCDTPQIAKFPLWEHQKAMLYKCLQIEKKSHIGVLADKPGTGKTFVVLSLVLQTISSNPCNLIVVPQNIFSQWDSSIKSFCDLTKINYVSFTNYSDISNLYMDTKVLKDKHMILTTSLYYHLVTGIINNIGVKISRVFFDEIDSINSMLREPIKSNYVWFVSASFDKNKIGCYTIDSLEDKLCICEDFLIEKSIPLKEPNEVVLDCYNLFIELVVDILPKETIAELNALDYNTNIYKFISKVPKNEKEFFEYLFVDIDEIINNFSNNVNSLLMAKKETETCGFYEGEALAQKVNAIKEQIKNYEAIVNGTVILKRQLYEKLKENKICPLSLIQLDNTHSKIISKCCSVAYKKDASLNIPCCLCGKLLEYPNSFLEERVLLQRKKPSISKQKYKIDIFKELAMNLKDSKTIIFSDYPFIFREIEDFFKRNSIEITTLDSGSLDTLDKSVKSYKEGTSSFLLVDSSLNGCGMNLENTHNIIFIHRTKSELEKQVIGRCQRPGRKSTLNIYRLLHKNEL
jgi:superfamily II DNA or RNA helicase